MAHPIAPEQAAERAAEFHTADAVRALNAANPKHWPRYEALYGELVVTPAPRYPHQTLAQAVLVELHAYLRREPVGEVLMAPADISWGRTDVLVQPDVFVFPAADVRAIRRTKKWTSIRHLLLAIEVASPSTRRRDRFAKRVLYQHQGVPLYWFVDPDRRLAEVWTPEAELPQVERERLVWHPEGAGETFTFDLAAAFAELDEG